MKRKMTAADFRALDESTLGQAFRAEREAFRQANPLAPLGVPLRAEPVGARTLALNERQENVRGRQCVDLGGVAGQDGVRHCLYEGHDFERCLPHAHKCPKSKDGGLTSCLVCPNHLPRWPYPASQAMSPRATREFIERQVAWPVGWTAWPNVRDAYRALADEAVANCPPCPDVSGRGIVTLGGGKYDAGLYVLAKMTRHVGCELPIQIWHRGDEEPVSDLVRSLPGVTVHDLTPRRSEFRQWGGWHSKMIAVMASGLAEVLFFDADAYPVVDPEPWFGHNPTGLVVWPDHANAGGRFYPNSYGLPTPAHCPPVNGGHYVIDVARAWPAVWLHHHYDMYAEYWYAWRAQVGGYGDQDQMRAAVSKLRFPFHRYAEAVLDRQKGAWVQAGPDGRAGCVHRIGQKFGLPGQFAKPPHRCPGVPLEDEAWQFFEEWKRSAVTPAAAAASDDMPEWWDFRPNTSDQPTWDEVIRGDVYRVRGVDMTGWRVLDVGGHIGTFAYAAWRAGAAAVHSYEPHAENFARLRANAAMMDGVTAFRQAVSDTNGQTVRMDNPSRHTTTPTAHAGGDVPTVSLDTAVERIGGRVDVLKMDCEGSEFPALFACTKLGSIRRIVMEFHSHPALGGRWSGRWDCTPGGLAGLLEKAGFGVEYHRSGHDSHLGYLFATLLPRPA